MENLIESIEAKTSSPKIKFAARFLSTLLVLLSVVTLVNDSGFGTEVEKYRIVILIATTGLALIIAIGWKVFDNRKDRKSFLYKDKDSGTLYLRDSQGLFREIPNDLTYSYLRSILNISKPPIEITKDGIDKSRGEKLIACDYWSIDRPLSSEESKKQILKRSVKLERGNVSFDTTSTHQKIRVPLINKGKLVKIENIRFSSNGNALDRKDLLFSYQYSSNSKTMVLIPFDRDNPYITENGEFAVILELEVNWPKEKFERHKNELGTLWIDLYYEGQLVNDYIITF